LKYLSESGVASVTFYETTGWRGVMERTQGTLSPKFGSRPVEVFPLHGVFADVAGFTGAQVYPVHSNSPLEAIGLALRKRGRKRLLLANLTKRRQRVNIAGVRDGLVLLSYQYQRLDL
jgi:hypothetical protein